jgi:hypothetical protein
MASRDYFPAVLLPLVFLAITGLLKRWKTTSQPPYPPGPKPRFLIGNFYDIPTEAPWLTYAEWGNRYGACRVFYSFHLRRRAGFRRRRACSSARKPYRRCQLSERGYGIV